VKYEEILVHKVLPTSRDILLFVDTCGDMDVSFGYVLFIDRGRCRMRGFIWVVEGMDEGIERRFPNFLLTRH
jgi:hypothetical protein